MEDLSWTEAIRKRPGMYIGGTDASGLTHLAFEVISNSLDEFAAGHATQIAVSVEDFVLTVQDDGRGFPFGVLATDGRPFDRAVLTELHTTATADGHAPHVHAHGLRGVGLAAVSALCDSLVIEAVRDGVHWRAVCSRGHLQSIEEMGTATWRGTRVHLRADPEVFGSADWPMHLLRPKLVDMSYLMQGLTLSLGRETFAAPNGLADRMRVLHGSRQPVFHARVQEEDFSIEVAAAGPSWLKRGFRMDGLKSVDSWCNGNRTREHGSHVDGVLRVLAKHAWWPETLFVSIIFNQPEYAGPSRGFLQVPQLRERVANALDPALSGFVNEHVEERK